MMAGFEFDDTTPDSVDEGDAGAARMSANRNIYTTIRDAAGNERGLNVDGNGAIGVGSVIPGTAATNLGKAIDSAVGGTDTGIAMLAVHTGEAAKLSVTEEDYDHLHVGELGGLFVEPEQHNHLDEFDVTTGWSALGNDTLNLATTKKHLTGSDALTFDKVDGAANTVIAGIQKTITAVNMGELDLHDVLQTVCYLSSLANVDYVFMRVGSDSTNYNEWRVQDDDLVAGEFTVLGIPIGSANQGGITGNGVNWADIKYIAIGVAFDAETNTLSGIIFDQMGLFTGSHVAIAGAEISSLEQTVKVKKWGNTNVTLNAGNVTSGTLRVVLATDQLTGSGALNLGKIEDGPHSSGDLGVMALAIRDDALTAGALVGADLDYVPLRTNNDGALWAQLSAGNLGGCKIFNDIDLDEADIDVATGACTVYAIYVVNTTASILHLKLFNTNSVTMGTTNATASLAIPANADSDGAGFVLPIPACGLAFSTALTVAVTTAAALDDNGAPGAGAAIATILFQD